MPDMPEMGAAARAADTAGQIAFGKGMQFKRQQEEDKIEADGVSALNSQVALDKYDFDEMKHIGSMEFAQIEDFENAYNQYNKGRQEYTKTLLSGKNVEVSQAITDHALKTEISSQSKYYNELDFHKTRFAQAKFFENQNTIAQGINSGNAEQKKAAMLANIDANKDFFTPAQANSLKAGIENDINKIITENEHTAYLEAVAVATRGLPLDDALKYINKIPRTKITEAERNGLLSQRNFEAAEINDQIEAEREESRDAISKGIRASEDVTQAIENSNLEEPEQWQWFERARAESERQVSGKDLVVDWGVYNNLQDTVRDYYDKKVSKADARTAINDAAGKQITESQAESFFKDIAKIEDPEDPTNRTSYKNGEAYVKDLTNQQFFWPSEIDDDAEGAELREAVRQNNLSGLRILDEYRKWLETQDKEPTDEDITNKIDELTQPFIEEKAASWISKLFRGSEGTGAAPPFGGGFPITKPKTVKPTGRIEVEKDGKKFTIPQEQLAEAEKQGYKRTK